MIMNRGGGLDLSFIVLIPPMAADASYFSSGSDAMRCPAGGVFAQAKNMKNRFVCLRVLGSFPIFLQGPSTTMTQSAVLPDCAVHVVVA